MSARITKEQWYGEGARFEKEFCSILPKDLGPGRLDQKNFMAAHERVEKKIAEMGFDAYMDMREAEEERILREAQNKDSAELITKLLEKSNLGKKFFTRTFDTFEVKDENEKAWAICYDIAAGKRKRGVVLSGHHGIGKTHLAAAVVNWMASKGHSVRFGNIVDIVEKVKDGFKTGTEEVIKNILNADLLVIDDLGAEHSKNESNWIDELLYKIINRAYEDDKTLIITTNLSDIELTGRYNQRIISRIREMCEVIEYSGDDHRFEATDEKTPWDKKG
jgi:DNA replication protein DnaC